jgi:alkylated DNA repair dioxygenase AlkB
MLPFPELTTPHHLALPDGDVTYYPTCFSREESNKFFAELFSQSAWRQDKLRLFKREVAQPRLTAWYGEPGTAYTYSGLTMHPAAWTITLLAIKERIEKRAGVQFNSVLLNLYRNGQDSVGWHADDEPALRACPVIASISFGAARTFQFRHKQNKTLKTSIVLESGSLLLMKGNTQLYWQHQIPKTAKPVGPRIRSYR